MNNMDKLFPIDSTTDIPPQWRDTPLGLLLEYQNLQRPLDTYDRAALLVGMCMDHRAHLRIPDNFSYIIRAGGGNLRYSEFKVSYAIAIGGVSHIALIGHNNCGMVNLIERRQAFIDGLVERGGWDREFAEQHFTHFAPMFEIGNSIDFLRTEASRLRKRYPKVEVAPLFFNVETKCIWGVDEDE